MNLGLTWLPPGLGRRSRALVTVGKLADEIVRVAREQKADVIVMETQGRRGVRHFLRRTVTERVMRKVAIPVITIWGIGASCSPHNGIRELAWMDEPGEPPTGQRGRGERFRTPRPSLAAQ